MAASEPQPAAARSGLCAYCCRLTIADLQGRIVEANSAFLDIVGRNFSQLAAETIDSITHPRTGRPMPREFALFTVERPRFSD